ncbi:TetR/AcrR family transcriptional regulator [Aureisphaera galaxeae]|uniref:TetR/AcrR family transcriptional regulator n=1 Tax=Aureisphaera galaxeae TaxID=1538023 RepID=UPI002350C5BA|nr:TetR/AcrR family transcriptional regulator [Aureisphaera galaxeae]MDC8004276.1 TetR/AcrR family transcriptional regulator [Aureisphaera galaxeae]
MDRLGIQITINPLLYSKDPESSELGRRIVSKSIEMMAEMGFETFTFKKLGVAIGSNESSIYRYFDSKHTLLIYLVNWYWSWMEYHLVFMTHSMTSPVEKLRTAIEMLTKRVTQDQKFSYIDEVLLYKIIIAESSKAYLTKDVDAENEKGFYKTYKRVVQRVSEMVLEINPSFEFPHMLISTVIEGSHHQRYFSEHLPSLTDFEEGKNNVVRFYTDLVFKTIS